MKLQAVKGTTSLLVRIFIQDSSATTTIGGLTGLTSGSSGLVCYRARDDDGNAAATAISLGAGTRGTWSSGGFVEKDATNMPGWYEFGITNASLATGSRSVSIELKGATNMVPVLIEIELTGWDNQDAVHGGMSALPNTACTTNASLITSGTGTDQLSVTSGRIDIGKALGTAVTLDANNVLNVSTKYIGGTAQTASDLGLISANTIAHLNTIYDTDYASVYDTTNKAYNVSAKFINGTSIAGTGSRVADAFVVMFNVATPVLTVASVNQTGDGYAIVNSGTFGNAAIKGYVDDIGAAGAGLTAIPWNAAWDAEVQSEVQDAIEANHLDHFIAVADPGGVVADSSFLAKLVSKSATPAFSSYVNTTDSLEAIRDRGDASWITATGFVTTSHFDTITGTPSDLGSGATVAGNLVDIEAQTDDIGAAGAGLTAADDAILAALAAGVTLTTAYDLYHADIHFTRDQSNTKDEYELTWFKNGVRQTSGITVPTIKVIKRTDGTDLIASTTPTQIGTTGSYKYDEATNRLTTGEAALVVVTATIDASTRSFSKIVGRDST